MSRQLLCVILLLHFHACFASRVLGFFHENLLNLQKDELLRSKEERTESHVKGVMMNCRMKVELCMEAMVSIKGAFEGEAESVKRTAVLGKDSKLEKQKQNRMMQQDMKIARAALESSTTPHGYDEATESEEPGEDIEVKDYAQPRRKTPIHNERP